MFSSFPPTIISAFLFYSFLFSFSTVISCDYLRSYAFLPSSILPYSIAFSLAGSIDVKATNNFNSQNIFESPEALLILEKEEINNENNNNHVEESGKHEIFNGESAGWLERKRVSAPSGVQRYMTSLLRHPTTINSSNSSGSSSSSNARHTKNLSNPCSSKEDEEVNFNTNTGSVIQTTSFNQKQPAALMIPKIVSGGKISALSAKQLPARKVPMNVTLPTNTSMTSSRAPQSSGIEPTVGIRGGIGTGTGIGIEGAAAAAGGGGRVQGKSIGMGTGVLMRSFCPSSSDVSRAAEGLPRHHTVRAPKMALPSTYNSINNSNGTNSININININHDERKDVVTPFESNSLHSLPAAVTRPPTSWTSPLPIPSIVPVPVLPTAADPKGNARAPEKHSASSFLQIDSDEDW